MNRYMKTVNTYVIIMSIKYMRDTPAAGYACCCENRLFIININEKSIVAAAAYDENRLIIVHINENSVLATGTWCENRHFIVNFDEMSILATDA